MLTSTVMGESPLLSLKGLLPNSWGKLKDWKKTQSSFNLTSPPRVGSGAFITYGEVAMDGT